VHNTVESSESLFEVITLWSGGMLWILLDRVLRTSVARQGFALGTSPSPLDGFMRPGDPMGKMIAWTFYVLFVFLPCSP
jgi:hypothetical protein